jgi:hypothetical protein
MSSDDEYEQGMEHSGCNDSKKVTDENHYTTKVTS